MLPISCESNREVAQGIRKAEKSGAV